MATEEDIKKYEDELKYTRKKTVHKIVKKDVITTMLPDLIRNQIKETDFTGYTNRKEESRVLFIKSIPRSDNIKGDGGSSVKRSVQSFLGKGERGWLVLDKTCFYPEGGGPIGDKGLLKTKTGQAEVLDCQKEGNLIFHEIEVREGCLEEQQKCQLEVNENFRNGIKASHTATHLLNSALRTVLGESVRQAGSLVEPGRLRFDFTHSKALTEKECQQVEEWVWQSIEKEEKLSPSLKSFEQAKKEGALFLKGENYDSKVRVINIGEKTSKELCGGIHVQNTKKIENF